MTAPSRPRIGIVVTTGYSPEDPDHDTPVLLEALAARDIDARAVVWHDATADLAAFDLLVIRSPWDYPARLGEFQAWLDRADAATRVVNPPATMRWNLDKRYLSDLDRAGVRVVPTEYCATVDEARSALLAHGHDRLVVKPTVSGGAYDTGLFDAADPRALALAARIVERGGVAMIQPEIAELTEGHERALYAIDGRHTHTIAKGALLEVGGGLIGGVYVEHPELVSATAEERAFGDDVLRAVREVTGGPTPLYARIDVVDSAVHGLVLLEVELIEPALNLHIATHAVDAVVDAILAAVPAEVTSPSTPERP